MFMEKKKKRSLKILGVRISREGQTLFLLSWGGQVFYRPHFLLPLTEP